MVSFRRSTVPRSNRNDNFIDKSFTVMADLIVKLLPINARSKEAYVYYRDGLSAQNDGDYAEALENYEEALKLEENPTDRSETLKNMAIIYMSNGEEERAIETYRKALDENPKQPSCLKNMGLIFEKWGRIAEEEGRQDDADRWFDQAAESWTQAVRLNPGGYLHRKLAEIHGPQQRRCLFLTRLFRIVDGVAEGQHQSLSDAVGLQQRQIQTSG